MTERWILNASPLIALGRIGYTHQRGLIDSAADVLRLLLKANFRLDEKVIRKALTRTVGERWD